MLENLEETSAVVAHIDATSSFGTKIRIEKLIGATVRHVCIVEEKKLRFSRWELVFYRLRIRSETVNVAEINVEKVERFQDIYGSLPGGRLRGW